MTLEKNQSKQVFTKTHDELILVVPRKTLLGNEAWQGLRVVNFDAYLSLINDNKLFLPRSAMEVDPTYKQIIPYLIYTFENKYFLMQRQSKASESRLQNKYTLGIGGHIRQEDMQNATTIFDWSIREFEEEVQCDQPIKTIEPLGILNDDSNDVGKVHVGFIFLLHGSTDKISVKSELKSGTLVSLDECMSIKSSMETWSQIVVDHLSSSI